VGSEPDDRETAARPQRSGHGGQRRREVHMVQRRVRAREVEAGLGHRVGQVVRLDDRCRPGPAARAFDRARAIIRASRSIAVTSAQRSASLLASRPSPQPTSSAAPQPAGTARRMTGW